jgi:hypothetical protein
MLNKLQHAIIAGLTSGAVKGWTMLLITPSQQTGFRAMPVSAS